jgi:hypothetical protein
LSEVSRIIKRERGVPYSILIFWDFFLIFLMIKKKGLIIYFLAVYFVSLVAVNAWAASFCHSSCCQNRFAMHSCCEASEKAERSADCQNLSFSGCGKCYKEDMVPTEYVKDSSPVVSKLFLGQSRLIIGQACPGPSLGAFPSFNELDYTSLPLFLQNASLLL